MKKRFRRKVLPVSFRTEPELDSYGDITVSKSGKITIKGRTLAKLERLAANAGLSVMDYLLQLIHEELSNPERLEKLVREQVKECRRLSSWCDRRRFAL